MQLHQSLRYHLRQFLVGFAENNGIDEALVFLKVMRHVAERRHGNDRAGLGEAAGESGMRRVKHGLRHARLAALFLEGDTAFRAAEKHEIPLLPPRLLPLVEDPPVTQGDRNQKQAGAGDDQAAALQREAGEKESVSQQQGEQQHKNQRDAVQAGVSDRHHVGARIVAVDQVNREHVHHQWQGQRQQDGIGPMDQAARPGEEVEGHDDGKDIEQHEGEGGGSSLGHGKMIYTGASAQSKLNLAGVADLLGCRSGFMPDSQRPDVGGKPRPTSPARRRISSQRASAAANVKCFS